MLRRAISGSVLALACTVPPVQANDELMYHPIFTTVPIPKSIDIENGGTVSAPLGEVTVNSPIVTLTINGKGPFYFMFDTGFSSTLVSKQVAKAAGLTKIKTINHRSRTPNQVIETQNDVFLADSIEVGNIVIRGLGVSAATESSPEYDSLEKLDGRGIDGILGFNAFYGNIVTVNYKNETITVSPESLKPTDQNVTQISKKASVPMIELELVFDKLDQSTKQHFVVDTGANPYFFINACQIPKMHDFVDKEQLLSKDFAGLQSKAYFAKMYGKIKILENYAVQSPYVTYASSNCDMDPFGLLGRKFFELHKVTIDVDDFLVKIEPFKR